MEDKKSEKLNELKTDTLLSYRGKAVEKMDQKEKLAQRLQGIKRSGEKIKERMPKKQVTEQHREEGRFKPVKPHNVKSVATVSPRITSDSANVKLREDKSDKDLPFTPDKKKVKPSTPGKYGSEYSTVRNIARQAMKKQKEKSVKEDVEQIDELSKEKLGSYAKKASFDVVTRAMKYGTKNDQSGREAKNLRKIHNREFGIRKAINRLTNEDVEQLDEISKQVLGSYIKKASHDVAAKGAATRQFANDSEAARKKEDYLDARDSMRRADKTFAKSWKRREGMAKAVDRLTKEETVYEGENTQIKGGDPCWKGYEMVGKKKKNGKEVPNCVPANEQMDNAPYAAPYAERKSGKDTVDSMSLAKQLAKTAAKKQAQRMTESVQLDEIMQEPDYNQSIKARQAAADKKSRKSQIVRDAAKKAKEKNKKNNNDKFESEPELSDSITKTE